MDDVHSTNPEAARGLRLKQAYDKHAASFKAMSAAEMVPINVDVTEVYTRSLGKLQLLGQLRHDVLTVSHMNVQLLLQLDEYLLALGHAHALYCARTLPADEIPGAFAELAAWCDKLRAESDGLVRRGIVRAERREPLPRSPSRARVGFEVLALVSYFQGRWPDIHDKTSLTEADLDTAAALADRLLVAIGVRSTEAMAMTIHMRLAAFNMFARAYDELRRGVSHLRWHAGDLDKLLPSVYARLKRGGKRAKKKKKPAGQQTDARIPSTLAVSAARDGTTDGEPPFSGE